MTTALDFEVANNATWRYSPLILRDDADVPLALPFDAEIVMQLRSPASSDDIALELSLANGRIKAVDLQASTVEILVPATAMKDVAAGSYEYDIVVNYTTGLVIRSVAGTVNVIQGVTR